MLRPLLALCLATGLVGSTARAQDPQETLDKAKKAYTEASDKARQGLLDAVKAASKAATASGNLDAVKALQAEKEAFEAGAKVPTSPRLKAAAMTYQLAMKQAAGTMEKAYEQAIRDLTKAEKIEQAEAVLAELKEFRAKAVIVPVKAPEVAGKDELQKALVGTTWTLDGGIKFKPDGYMQSKSWETDGLVVKWEVVDRRTVILIVEKGRDTNRLTVLNFSEDLAEFRGFMFDGNRMPPQKRKP